MDLRRVYGVRLRELFTGGMTWRELGVYLRGLPPGSATRIAMNDGKPEPSPETVLLADVFDMLQHVDWHIQAKGVEKKSDLPRPPKPYPRWWETGTRRAKNTPQRRARLEDARRREARRQQQIANGQLA